MSRRSDSRSSLKLTFNPRPDGWNALQSIQCSTSQWVRTPTRYMSSQRKLQSCASRAPVALSWTSPILINQAPRQRPGLPVPSHQTYAALGRIPCRVWSPNAELNHPYPGERPSDWPGTPDHLEFDAGFVDGSWGRFDFAVVPQCLSNLEQLHWAFVEDISHPAYPSLLRRHPLEFWTQTGNGLGSYQASYLQDLVGLWEAAVTEITKFSQPPDHPIMAKVPHPSKRPRWTAYDPRPLILDLMSLQTWDDGIPRLSSLHRYIVDARAYVNFRKATIASSTNSRVSTALPPFIGVWGDALDDNTVLLLLQCRVPVYLTDPLHAKSVITQKNPTLRCDPRSVTAGQLCIEPAVLFQDLFDAKPSETVVNWWKNIGKGNVVAGHGTDKLHGTSIAPQTPVAVFLHIPDIKLITHAQGSGVPPLASQNLRHQPSWTRDACDMSDWNIASTGWSAYDMGSLSKASSSRDAGGAMDCTWGVGNVSDPLTTSARDAWAQKPAVDSDHQRLTPPPKHAMRKAYQKQHDESQRKAGLLTRNEKKFRNKQRRLGLSQEPPSFATATLEPVDNTPGRWTTWVERVDDEGRLYMAFIGHKNEEGKNFDIYFDIPNKRKLRLHEISITNPVTNQRLPDSNAVPDGYDPYMDSDSDDGNYSRSEDIHEGFILQDVPFKLGNKSMPRSERVWTRMQRPRQRPPAYMEHLPQPPLPVVSNAAPSEPAAAAATPAPLMTAVAQPNISPHYKGPTSMYSNISSASHLSEPHSPQDLVPPLPHQFGSPRNMHRTSASASGAQPDTPTIDSMRVDQAEELGFARHFNSVEQGCDGQGAQPEPEAQSRAARSPTRDLMDVDQAMSVQQQNLGQPTGRNGTHDDADGDGPMNRRRDRSHGQQSVQSSPRHRSLTPERAMSISPEPLPPLTTQPNPSVSPLDDVCPLPPLPPPPQLQGSTLVKSPDISATASDTIQSELDCSPRQTVAAPPEQTKAGWLIVEGKQLQHDEVLRAIRDLLLEMTRARILSRLQIFVGVHAARIVVETTSGDHASEAAQNINFRQDFAQFRSSLGLHSYTSMAPAHDKRATLTFLAHQVEQFLVMLDNASRIGYGPVTPSPESPSQAQSLQLNATTLARLIPTSPQGCHADHEPEMARSPTTPPQPRAISAMSTYHMEAGPSTALASSAFTVSQASAMHSASTKSSWRRTGQRMKKHTEKPVIHPQQPHNANRTVDEGMEKLMIAFGRVERKHIRNIDQAIANGDLEEVKELKKAFEAASVNHSRRHVKLLRRAAKERAAKERTAKEGP